MAKSKRGKTKAKQSKHTRGRKSPTKNKPAKSTPKQARAEIERRLNAAKGELDLGRVLVHAYGDGSVDGEWSVSVPRGTSTEDFLKDIRDAFDTVPGGLGTEYWLQVGERYTIKEDDEVYRRYKGMNELGMHFTRVNTSNIISTFGAARTMMTRGAEKKYRRKADSVFVRIHWNPANAKPKR